MNQVSLLARCKLWCAKFWVLRDTRERIILSAASLLLVFVLIYLLLFDPALTGRDQLSKQLPVLRQQVAQLQSLSKQAATLAAKPAPLVSAITKEKIEASLARKGLKPQNLTLTGAFLKLQLAAVSFADTLDWLDEMQKTDLLSVVEANLVVQASPDTVNATITLRQQGYE